MTFEQRRNLLLAAAESSADATYELMLAIRGRQPMDMLAQSLETVATQAVEAARLAIAATPADHLSEESAKLEAKLREAAEAVNQ